MALHQITTILRPETSAEAWTYRRDHHPSARYLAGGIELVLQPPPSVSTLIDLSRVGLDRVDERDEGLILGSMLTMSQLIENPLLQSYCGGLVPRVLRHVASPLQRSLGTLGGTIARGHSWSDVIPLLLALDSKLEIYDDGANEVTMAEYYTERRNHPLALVEAVRLPGGRRNWKGAFEKFGRTGFDIGMLNCVVAARMNGECCEDVRISVGGTPSAAQRVPEVEAMLTGMPWEPSLIEAAARAAQSAVKVRDDRRASATYRRTLVEVGIRRCLERVAGEADDQEDSA